MSTAVFSSEPNLNAFAKKHGLKFATAFPVGDDARSCLEGESFVKAMRMNGKKVVIMNNYACGQDYYLVFHA